MSEFFGWYVDLVLDFGYVGIFVMTLIEGTILPIPSETTMLPAGVLIASGEMNFWAVLISSVTGTWVGALINYYIARRYGRQLVINYGKYFFFTEKKLISVESFFSKYGEISTFTGRLTPGVRHLISFVAGLSQMELKSFSFFTVLGASVWMLILIVAGYYIGENKTLLKKFMPAVTLTTCLIVAMIAGIYYYIRVKKR